MSFLYLLESIRNPLLDALMSAVTKLGEETTFLVIAILVFWCVDKDRGYYVMTVGFLGTMLNQFLKMTFRIPRPWVLDPEFSIVETAREAASGFSFPSGHSTSAVGTFGAVGLSSERKWVRRICFGICVLVPFSRMYLGVHTPWDVLAGAATAIMLLWLMRPMAFGVQGTTMRNLIGLQLGCSVIMLLYAAFFPFSIPEGELHNLQSGVKNGYTMLGSIVGLMIAYPLEKKYVNFETKAIWWVQCLKAVLGLALVLAVKEGLRAPLDLLFGGRMIARSVRYACVVLTAGVIWPSTFKWFSKIGVKR